MKNVLVVDDAEMVLKIVKKGLANYADSFVTLTASSAHEATHIIRTTAIDMLVTDLRLPDMDGFDLLAHMNKKHPNVPVIVITGYEKPDLESKVQQYGVLKVLRKPFKMSALAETILTELDSEVKGYLIGIGLPSFLQLLQVEQKTCTLRVKSAGRRGYLYIVRGQLFHAQTDEHQGEEAAYHILSWDETRIDILETATSTADQRTGIEQVYPRRPKESTIECQLTKILVEAARLCDERRNAKHAPASATSAAMPGVTGETLVTPDVSKPRLRTSGPFPPLPQTAGNGATPHPTPTPTPTPPPSGPLEVPEVITETIMVGKFERGMVLQVMVMSAEKIGYLHLLAGELIDAEATGLRGEAAVHEILSWPNPKIKTSHQFRRIHRTILKPMIHMVNEAKLLEKAVMG